MPCKVKIFWYYKVAGSIVFKDIDRTFSSYNRIISVDGDTPAERISIEFIRSSNNAFWCKVAASIVMKDIG